MPASPCVASGSLDYDFRFLFFSFFLLLSCCVTDLCKSVAPGCDDDLFRFIVVLFTLDVVCVGSC